MGQPAGMKSLVIWGGKVYDIKTAVDEHVMMDPSIRWRPNRYGNSALLSRLCTYLVEDDPEALDADYLNLLRNAAPNLALNVRDATAPAWELWTCAIVGVALQMIAAIIPGIATYHWKWTKAGVEVPGYGYPCFLIGTLLVVLGTMACGHVIEGVTTEHTFQAAEGKDVQILQLQRACTVSDQNFSSCAIFNNKDNHSIRTSRLNGDDYR